jgi:hypothetical protein
MWISSNLRATFSLNSSRSPRVYSTLNKQVFLLFYINFLRGVFHGLQQKDIGRYSNFQHLNYVLRSATKFI